MSELNKMQSAYLECALWASGGEFDHFTIYDFPADVEKRLLQEVGEFQQSLSDEELDYVLHNEEQCGHDLWLTQNYHGAGFWDRGLGGMGNSLTGIAQLQGTVELYIDDDGNIAVYG